jgi:hypothetical protein
MAYAVLTLVLLVLSDVLVRILDLRGEKDASKGLMQGGGRRAIFREARRNRVPARLARRHRAAAPIAYLKEQLHALDGGDDGLGDTTGHCNDTESGKRETKMLWC